MAANKGFSWLDLPNDILEMILNLIPYAHHPNVTLVCRTWNQACQTKLHPVQKTPLLLYFKQHGDGILNYYSPYYNKTFKGRKKVPQLVGTRLYTSKEGFIVAYKKHEVILFNPINKASFSCPGLQYEVPYTGIIFSGTPGTENLTVFCIRSSWEEHPIEISVWRKGEWDECEEYENEDKFCMSQYSSPLVGRDGCFYCIGKDGRMGVFDAEKKVWGVRGRSKARWVGKEVHLVGWMDDGIMAMICGNGDAASVLEVARFDVEKMKWEMVHSLGRMCVFIGLKGAVLKEVNVPRRMRNSVYTWKGSGSVEVAEAEVVVSEGTCFFLTKRSDGGIKDRSTTTNMVCCNVGSSSRYSSSPSFQYLFSVWYDAAV